MIMMMATTHSRVSSEADQPEDRCGGQDDQHHSAEAGPLIQQQCDALNQPVSFGCLPGAE
jgi:hypothetical protein